MKAFLALIVAVLGATLPLSGRAQAVNSGHVALELGARGAAVPGKTLYLALRQTIRPGWHTYWRNPGDAGEPPRVTWTLPAGWSAGDFVWPAPKRLSLPPLMDYGFENSVLLPVPVRVPASARPGSTVQVRAAVSLLVCQAVCVPEQAQISLAIPVSASETPSVRWAPAINQALAAAPTPGALKAAMAVQGKAVKLAVAGSAAVGARDAYFFPYSATAITHAAPQRLDRGPKGLTLTLAPGVDFARTATLSGVLVVNGKGFEITARRGALPVGTSGLGAPAGLAQAGPAPADGPATAGSGAGLGLPLAGLFAFLGGVVLNLMPCVFPILSMKALAVARHGEDRQQARRQGVAFLLGVLATFLGLAAILLIARGLGAQIGWGFQLQSPIVVAALAILMLLIALNLSGVFEAGLSLQRAGGASSVGGGATGAFLTGALAVVVAAPCTAPLMAAAVAYGLTQGPVAAVVVFAALGLGFAAPFTLVAFLPALQRRLPKPGAWMEALKKLLAFPMYAAAAWLLWVFTLQTGSAAMAALLAAGVAAALAAWLYGWAQRRRAEGRGALPIHAATGLAAVAAVAVLAGGLGANAGGAPSAASAGATGSLPSQAWSADSLASLQAQGRPVLVDFTAAWCVTCQVNERVALSSGKVADAFKEANAVYMRADWTRQDPAIAKALAQHGRAGVPLYLVYPKGGGAPEVLPQVLSEDVVLKALRKAAA